MLLVILLGFVADFMCDVRYIYRDRAKLATGLLVGSVWVVLGFLRWLAPTQKGLEFRAIR